MTLTERHRAQVSLPLPEPTLVMVGSEDPNSVRGLDRLLRESVSAIDLRSNSLWTEVENGRLFLEQALAAVPDGRDQIRFGFAPPGATVQELLRHALLASTLAELGLRLEELLSSAVSPTYQVRYQPIVSLRDRSIIGFESLIWASDGQEILSADDLIDRATEADWLDELDSLARALAIEGVGPWLGEGLLFLNVLAPGGEFDQVAVQRTIDQAQQAGLAPDQLVLEAVERNRYASLDHASAQIEDFRELGVRIAVDDVGDGYASLRTVTALKPDIIKIAGSLARDLTSPEGKAVVGAIVHLAHESGAWVVAENLETADQARLAAELGVDWGQGHFFGSPGLP